MHRFGVLCVCIILIAAGCQSRLKIEKTITLEVGQISTIEIDPPRYDQTIAIAVSADVPVDVFVYLTKNQEAAERDINLAKKSDLILGSAEKVERGSVEARVPAKEKSTVMIRSGTKGGSVKVTIAGK